MSNEFIVSLLRGKHEETQDRLFAEAADALEVTQAKVDILQTAITAAATAMAYAPIWHHQHRVISEILNAAKKTLEENT